MTPHPPPAHDPLRVLVVDDSATIRAAVGLALDSPHTEVHEAEDGEEGLLRAHLVAPHVILLDVDMPRMDGLAVLSALRGEASLRDIPVVMVTHADAPEDIARTLEAGAHDYLRKPFEPLELRARVAAAGRTGRLVAELRRVNAELDRSARTDHLTGLPNRREMDRALQRAGNTGLVVGLADIDHFKQVNDRHGHDVGDVVLQRVADRLGAAVREGDVVGRWGGEEFLLILQGSDADGAVIAARRLLDAVRRPLDVPDGPARVTVSIGLAVRDAADAHVAELITVADAQLYAAKQAGRDRAIVTAEGAPPREVR